MSDGETFDDRAAALAIAEEAKRAGVLLVSGVPLFVFGS